MKRLWLLSWCLSRNADDLQSDESEILALPKIYKRFSQLKSTSHKIHRGFPVVGPTAEVHVTEDVERFKNINQMCMRKKWS